MGDVAVSMLALVGALDITEMSGGALMGNGAFVDSRDGGDVVTASRDGGVPDVEVV